MICSTGCIDGRLGDQPAQAVASPSAVWPRADRPAGWRVPKLDLRADDRLQPLVVPRLLDEVAGAAAHRFDRQVHRAPRGHHDHRQRRIDLLDLLSRSSPSAPEVVSRA
jgi:hypothetical protein